MGQKMVLRFGKLSRVHRERTAWLIGLFLVVLGGVLGIVKIQEARAVNLENFRPGNIISDWQMSNYQSMSERGIQAFLTEKNPCNNTDYDLYLRLSNSDEYTWHWDDGHFVCLSEELFGDGDEIGTGETAAHIIWQAAQDYQINPQVLITILQRESNLVTDTFPNDGDYWKAMGFGCPDTGTCSEEYRGFKNQIRQAAAMFRSVLDGGWSNYRVGDNYIQYAPNAECGGSVVNIENLATAALYRYTPYQPNAAALEAGAGEGDICSSYGNRNFYLLFEGWFSDYSEPEYEPEEQVEMQPHLTLMSVEQYDEVIEPVWDEYLYNGAEGPSDFGSYYYPVANNMDLVRVGIKVDGLEEGKTYKIFGDQTITADDNGEIVYKELRPTASMEDSMVCYENEYGDEHCSGNAYANEYITYINLLEDGENWNNYDTIRVIFRPEKTGSSDIEILSVKQDGVDVHLDTAGRQTKNISDPQTINEYQLMDYSKPVTIEYKLKNLHEGWMYSVNTGYGAGTSFVADSNEKIDTAEVYLDTLRKHTSVWINIYGYEVNQSGPSSGLEHSSSVQLYFRVADANYVQLGNVIIDEVSQNGTKIDPEVGGNDYQKEYSFLANDIDSLTVKLHADAAMDEAKYYLSYNLSSMQSSYPQEREWTEVTGAELKEGVALTVKPKYDGGEESPFTLYVQAKCSEESGNYNNVKIYYGQFDFNNYGGNVVKFNFYEDSEIPRYESELGYANYPEVKLSDMQGIVSDKYHDVDNPLSMTINGAHYENDTMYDVNVTVTGRAEYRKTVSYSGEELNAGVKIVLDGLVMELPVINVADIGGIGVVGYNFTVDINGIKEFESASYLASGSLRSDVIYDGEEDLVVRDGTAGAAYIGSSGWRANRAAFDNGEVVLRYAGSEFDNATMYNYEIYYDSANELAGTSTGEKIMEGVISGQELNGSWISIAMEAPTNETKEIQYSVAIKKGDGLAVLMRDRFMIVGEGTADMPVIQNVANEIADVKMLDENTMAVTSAQACTVVGLKDGEYMQLSHELTRGTNNAEAANTPVTHNYDIEGYDEIYVALKGDVSMDGLLNSTDALQIARHYNGNELIGVKKAMADVNNDGLINSTDALAIARHYNGTKPLSW